MKVPFDREKAAQFLIVAWVKEWNIQTYMHAINAKDVPYAEMHSMYPWMPSQENIHLYFKNVKIRPWVAMAMKGINDRLFDAKDNAARLALAGIVENWNSAGAKPGFSHKDALKERRESIRLHRQTAAGHAVANESARRSSGHHWNVIK
jgi:hypothetical protein